MKYILNENILLRKWRDGLPWYMYRGSSSRRRLTEEEWTFLCRCDGVTGSEPSFLADRLELSGMIRPAGEGASLMPDQIREYENVYIQSIDINITDVCNYNCLHCFHAADNGVKRDVYTREELQRLLDEIRDCGIAGVRLTGGEPTLHPEFREILSDIRQKGLQLATLITNGSRLDPEMVAFIRELHPDAQIMISFDGIGCHDWLRQHPGAEEQALRAIRLCKEAGFYVMINANVNRKNRAVMTESVELLADLGVDMIRIIRTTEAPRWQLNAGDETLTTEEYYDFSAEFAKAYRESGVRVPVMIWQSLYLDPARRRFSCFPVKSSVENFREDIPVCTAFHLKPSVLTNGDIVHCSPMAGYYELWNLPKENVKRDGLRKILTESSFSAALDLTVKDKLRANDKCAACPYVRNCQGGCPALSVLSGGDFLSPDGYKCVFFNKGYYEVFCEALSGWKNMNPMHRAGNAAGTE